MFRCCWLNNCWAAIASHAASCVTARRTAATRTRVSRTTAALVVRVGAAALLVVNAAASPQLIEPPAGFRIVSGSGYCHLSTGSDGRSCVTDGVDYYGNNERCTIEVLQTGLLSATEFNTESGYG